MIDRGDSPFHRLGTGWKLVLVSALCTAVAVAEKPLALAAIGSGVVAIYALSAPSRRLLALDVRCIAIQLGLILAFHAVRFGITEGLHTGALTAVRIGLFYLPAASLIRTTRASRMMSDLERVLPYRISFLVFVSLRFFPVFIREFREVAAAQRLRGARLAPRSLLNPRNWKDVMDCLFFPVIVRSFKTAQDAALSAEAREFGLRPTRSHWDPRDPVAGLAGDNPSSSPGADVLPKPKEA